MIEIIINGKTHVIELSSIMPENIPCISIKRYYNDAYYPEWWRNKIPIINGKIMWELRSYCPLEIKIAAEKLLKMKSFI